MVMDAPSMVVDMTPVSKSLGHHVCFEDMDVRHIQKPFVVG
jgi:hypothetical protein